MGNMFIGVWKAIKDEGVWAGKDWTIKVDVDAVFLPIRLRQYIGKLEVTENGIYLENCKWVNYGFFGSLEVLSQAAAGTYMESLDDCRTALNYLGHEKVTGNEPWGEDLFAQRCMDLHGALRARRKTGNGALTAQPRRPQQSTTSRNPRSTSTASRPPSAEVA